MTNNTLEKATNNKIFSIIIPCYNVQDYIDRVMKSVMDQTIDRELYEVIAVNDASTDNTLSKLCEWADRFPNTIRIITYDVNLRQGGARNLAIKDAVGEYICFVDADDWIEHDALETYSYGASLGNYDIITAKNEENYQYEMPIEYKGQRGIEYPVEKEYGQNDRNELIGSDLDYVCNSVYRRSIIIENDIWFPEHLAYEDIYWQRLIKFYAKSAIVIDHRIYHHYIHAESTIGKRNAPHQTDRLTSYEMLLETCEKRGFLEQFYMQMMNDTMETYLFNSYFMFFVNMDDIPDVYGRIRKTLYKYFPDWEAEYDDSNIPMVFQYLLKFLKKAVNAKPADLQPFKEAVLEIIAD